MLVARQHTNLFLPLPGGGSPRNLSSQLLAEGLVWQYIVQLASALRAVHAANLAVRALDPAHILLMGKGRSVCTSLFLLLF